MSRVAEWMKTAVMLCTSEGIAENEKKQYFSDLESIYGCFSDEEKYAVHGLLQEFQVKDVIYLLSYMNAYMNIEDFKGEVLDYIVRGDFDWCVGSMLELQAIAKINGQYSKKRILHKKNVDKCIELFEVDWNYIEPADRNKKRIAIMTEQLISTLHAPTKVVLEFAYVLQKCLGYEVLVFSCPCDAALSQELWYDQMGMTSVDVFRYRAMKRVYKGELIRGYQINMTRSSPKEYAMMLELIYYWNPLFVFGMGLVNPVSNVVRQFTTLVEMPMSLECPVSEADILLRLGRTDEAMEQEYIDNLGTKQRQIFLEEKIPVVAEKSAKVYTRLELGLPENKFLIALVGNRLDVEIDHECVRVMERILENVPESVFVIIGKVEIAKELWNKEMFEEKIYCLGYCEDLMGVYTVMDLYMNPKRNGGGFSSSMAMIAGVPVVTLANCDVAYNVGEEFVVDNYDCMIEEIHRYATDSEYYMSKKEQTRINSERNTGEKMVAYVDTVMTQIIDAIERGA